MLRPDHAPRHEAVRGRHGGDAGVLRLRRHPRSLTVPPFIEDELGAGELGVGLSLAVVRPRGDLRPPADRPPRRALRPAPADDRRRPARRRRRAPSPATSATLPQLLALRGVAGIGEAALFVGAATLVADLRRPIGAPRRRATSPSPCSAGSASGRSSARRCSAATTSTWRSSIAGGVHGARRRAGARSCRTPCDAVARRARPHDAVVAAAALHPSGRGRPRARAGAGIVAGFAAFSAFLPDHARSIGLRGSGGLFAATASCASCCASSAPACPSASARAAPSRSRSCSSAPRCCARRGSRAVGAVGRGGRDRRRHGVHVPVADGAHRQPRRRSRAARRDQLVHDVLRGRHRSRRPRARCVAQLVGKRARSPAPSCCARSACGCCGARRRPAAARELDVPPVPPLACD